MIWCLCDSKLNKQLVGKDVRRLQVATSVFILECYEKWLVESAQIIRWMEVSPMVNSEPDP